MATASNSAIPRTRTFGRRLDEAVRDADPNAPLQQEQLSRWFATEHGIKISGGMISRYRSGALPRMDQCREYAMALGVAVEWLYSERGLKHPGPPLTPDEQEIIHRLRSIEDPEEHRNWIGHMLVSLPKAPSRPNGQKAA